MGSLEVASFSEEDEMRIGEFIALDSSLVPNHICHAARLAVSEVMGGEQRTENYTLSNHEDSLGVYLDEMGAHPLLNKEHEVALAKLIEEGKKAQATLHSLGDTAPVERQEELALAVETGNRARYQFIVSNLRLVVSVAKREQGDGVPLIDRIQNGTIGLMRAVEKFDPDKGFKFSTYATPWIKQRIQKGGYESARAIRLPGHIVEAAKALSKTKAAMLVENAREPNTIELAEETRNPLKVVAYIERASNLQPTSLDESVADGSSASIGDFVKGGAGTSTEQVALDAILSSEIQQVLEETLDQNELEIVALRFGFGGGEPLSIDALAKATHYHTRMIRKILAEAEEKIRSNSKAISLFQELE